MKVKRELIQFNSFDKYREFDWSLQLNLNLTGKGKNQIKHTCYNFIKKSHIPFLFGFCSRHATGTVTCPPRRKMWPVAIRLIDGLSPFLDSLFLVIVFCNIFSSIIKCRSSKY